ncbi:hypothetical protein ACFSQ3_03185 [Sphingobacterium corticis]|uniref:Lipoprotein n=1 Tax=Sphingobacterium corticis TaxID=1812823 RepID=A0ABW5NIU1_9SPHI
MVLHALRFRFLIASVVFFVVFAGLFSCNQFQQEEAASDGVNYVAIKSPDTAYLTLSKHGDRFFGKLLIRKPGLVVEFGEVRGEIKDDIFIGDYPYLPFGDRYHKRKGFALKDSSGYLIRGYGTHHIYMGIPYLVEGTISFPQDGFVFERTSVKHEE